MIETPGCPNCQNPQATQVSFTWWGGLIGPRILSHVSCVSCGTQYNAKTGQSNNTKIAIYMGSIFAFTFVIMICCGVLGVFGANA